MSVSFVPLNRDNVLLRRPDLQPIPLKPAAPAIEMPADRPILIQKDNEPKPLDPSFKDIYMQKREDLRKSADGMEGMMVRQVMKAMRSTIPVPEGDEDLFGSSSHATQMFTQMMDDTLSEKISSNGDFGIADRIFKSHVNILTQEFAEQLAAGQTTPFGIPIRRR